MKILSIETSCDETAAAVSDFRTILSSVRITQEIHSEYGGVVPSLAKRDHEANIDFVINKALDEAGVSISEIEGIAVTQGPGLAIALEVGIKKAKQLSNEYSLPLFAINHIEGHLLSPLAIFAGDKSRGLDINFPALGLVVSGGHTELVFITDIGKYKILAQTHDDALGEALDKTARILGYKYPGAALLEKAAIEGNDRAYNLPLPMAGREDEGVFSYSGLKSAVNRLVADIIMSNGQLTDEERNNIAASFQRRAFEHLIRICEKSILKLEDQSIKDILVGGGVAMNKLVRKMLVEMGMKLGINVHFAAEELFTDNAAMIGVVAGFKAKSYNKLDPSVQIDRQPRMKVDHG